MVFFKVFLKYEDYDVLQNAIKTTVDTNKTNESSNTTNNSKTESTSSTENTNGILKHRKKNLNDETQTNQNPPIPPPININGNQNVKFSIGFL